MVRPAPLAALALALALPLAGCHGKLKRAAPTLGAVRLQVVTTGQPSADLGTPGGWTEPDLANAAVMAAAVVQEARAIELAGRIAGAVDIDDVNAELVAGIEETLGDGPPFGITTDRRAPLLQLELVEYGLFVPYIGAPGRFTYTVRASLYTAEGERIYRSRLSCDAGVGDPRAAAQVLDIVNNVRQVQAMSDRDINAAFGGIARYCGQQFVVKLRRHAG